jgi:phytoene/squalene synthetase
MIALGQTITRRRLDPAPFHRLIDAFELDQRRDEHVTWRELVSYCERSANPVGEIVLNLGGVFRDSHPALLAMSDDACTALQITNHLQDLRSDLLDRGRLYIPSEVTGLGRAELLTLAKMSGAGAEGANARERTRLALSPVWERASSLYQRARSLPRLVGQTPAARLAPLVWLLVAGGRRTHGLLAQRGLCGLWRRERLARPQAGLLILGAIARRAVWRARVSPAPRPIGATA